MINCHCFLFEKLFCIEKNSCWLLYLSTDYVFDGKAAPYQVGDTPNPLNNYGKMKLAGEQCVLSSNPGNY